MVYLSTISSMHESFHNKYPYNMVYYETKIQECEKASSHQESNPGHSGLSRQCSATKPQQLNNHQPSQSSMIMRVGGRLAVVA